MTTTGIIGTGGIGGYFGARLLEAGHAVRFFARGPHKAMLETEGLRLQSLCGDVHLPLVEVSDELAEFTDCDLLLICVKSWQLEALMQPLAEKLSSDVLLLPLLNGIEAESLLREGLPSARILKGLCGIVSYLDSPGRVVHSALAEPFIKIGVGATSSAEDCSRVSRRFQNTIGVNLTIEDDMDRALWEKFLFIVASSAAGAITRQPAGIWRQGNMRKLIRKMLEEAFLVGKTQHINLAEDTVNNIMQGFDQVDAAMTTSMQRDMAQTSPSELDAQIGAVVRMAKQHSISVPVSEVIWTCLSVQEQVARQQLS